MYKIDNKKNQKAKIKNLEYRLDFQKYNIEENNKEKRKKKKKQKQKTRKPKKMKPQELLKNSNRTT